MERERGKGGEGERNGVLPPRRHGRASPWNSSSSRATTDGASLQLLFGKSKAAFLIIKTPAKLLHY